MNATPVTQTSKELVRLLLLEHSQKEVSDITGINYDTIRKWSQRNNWPTSTDHSDNLKLQSQSVPNAPERPKNAVSTVADRMSGQLKQNESRTRYSLSRAHRIHAARAARGKLSPKETLQTAQAAAITHNWRSEKALDQANVAVNIAILSA